MLVLKISENFGNLGVGGRLKPMTEIMQEAGYAKSSAYQQTQILTRIRPYLDPFVEKFIAHRDKILEEMDRKISSAKYIDLAKTVHIFTKWIYVLSSGYSEIGPTQRLSDEQFDRLLTQINKRALSI